MTSTATTRANTDLDTRRGRIVLRTGLGLAAILAALQIQTGIAQLPDPLAYVLIGLPILSLAACIPAWRGVYSARLVVAVGSVLPALTGLPVYFIPDLPAEAVISASIGILLSLVIAALVLFPRRTL